LTSIGSMKHYLIAFSLVFSVLTSSWSGASVQVADSQPCHQMEVVSHDCCDEMMQVSCVVCDSECHCDVSVSHSSVALLAVSRSNLTASLYSLVNSTNRQLPAEPFQRKFLPPKI